MATHLKIKEISVRAGRSITIPYQYIDGGAKSQKTNQNWLPHLCLLGAQNRAEILHNSCILGGHQCRARGENQKRLLHPCLLGGQKRAEMLHHPCILGGPLTKREKIRIGCLTPTFTGAQKRAEMLCNPCILGRPRTKGEKLRSGCLTPTFLGAQKRAEVLRNPCILGSPTKGTISALAASPIGVGIGNSPKSCPAHALR